MSTKAEAQVFRRLNLPLAEVDPQVAEILRDEARREATGLELIPSENFVSEAVLEAMGDELEAGLAAPRPIAAAPAKP